MYCPCDHQMCLDETCRVSGCRICGAVPLEICEDCGEPVAFVRRLTICDICLVQYGPASTDDSTTTVKG